MEDFYANNGKRTVNVGNARNLVITYYAEPKTKFHEVVDEVYQGYSMCENCSAVFPHSNIPKIWIDAWQYCPLCGAEVRSSDEEDWPD